MSNIHDRFTHLVRHSGESIKSLADASGIEYRRWISVLNGRARLSGDLIEFAAKRWPRFSLWLVLGEMFENDEVCLDDLVSPDEFDKQRTTWALEDRLEELQKAYENRSKEEILELLEKLENLKK